ncbi:MAG: fatty acid desaturase [Cyanobacteria bacterium P01_A01_bin.137]
MMIEATAHSQYQSTLQQKLLLNISIVTYTFFAYVGGTALLLSSEWGLNSLGVLLVIHSLVYSAYLSHELMHGSLFKKRRWNAILGSAMLWLNGGCYFGFKDLAEQHIAHHVDRVDVFTFDIATAIQMLPQPMRWGIISLEWLYFPIVSFWARWQSVLCHSAKDWRHRSRIAVFLLIRVALFVGLGWVSIKALLLYFVAYIGMITVLRFVDAFQHTYEAFLPGTPLPRRDRSHEQAHTFSNLLSRRYPWLNILLLNFGYHNAHHAMMSCPWYSLPDLDQKLAEAHQEQYISVVQQLKNYHRFRIKRLFAGQGHARDKEGNSTPDCFYGAIDVSFLTLY